MLNTLNVSFPGVLGREVLTACPEIAASTGSACHQGGQTLSGVLQAMGVPPEVARGPLRLSRGLFSTEAEVERVVCLSVLPFGFPRWSTGSGEVMGHSPPSSRPGGKGI